MLGIFGREGVFAAMVWPNAGVWSYDGSGPRAYAYLFGAFNVFRNFDGKGGRFGDVGVAASTSDASRTSVYASTDKSSGSPRLVVIAINKTSAELRAQVVLTDPRRWTRGEVYAMMDGAPTPVRRSDLAAIAGNLFTYAMPAMSVSTLVLRP